MIVSVRQRDLRPPATQLVSMTGDSIGRLVGLLALALTAGGCVQPLDVGSNLDPISHEAERIDDAGYVTDWDAGVPCGPFCAAEDGGSPLCAGDLLIGDIQGWQAFLERGCIHFSGNLKLQIQQQSQFDGGLQNDVLQSVSGNLWVQADLPSVTFSQLTTLGGTLDLALNAPGPFSSMGSPGLTTVTFPRLATAGSINVVGNPSLTTLWLPALTEVRGHLSIQANDSLVALNFPSLTAVRGSSIGVSNNPVLATLSLPVLGRLGLGFGVQSNPALTSLRLPAVTSAGAMYVTQNAALEDFEAPSLAAVTSLAVSSDDSLNSLSLPVLRVVSERLDVTDNPKLRQCLVDAVVLGLASAPPLYTGTHNDGMPNTCP
jgi:hypothetical protein